MLKLRDKAFKQHKRRFANYVVAVVQSAFSWALDRELGALISTRPIVPLHDKPKKVVFGTGKGFLSPEAIAAIEAPLPDDVLAAFHGNMEP